MRLRIIWLCIVVPYFTIFFMNRFASVPNHTYPLIFSYGLVGWLAFEFYIKNSFFQSGRIPHYAYPTWLRLLIAIYFYGSFIWANFLVEERGGDNLFGLIGIAVLLSGISLRIKADWDFSCYPKRYIHRGIYRRIRHPCYLGLMLIALAMGLCFNSLTIFVISVAVGLPLLYLESRYDEAYLSKREPEYHSYQKRVRYFGIL